MTDNDQIEFVLAVFIIFAGFAIAGSIDIVEEERLAAEPLVAHHVSYSAADDLPGLDQLDAVRYAEPTLAQEPVPCR